MHHHAGHQRRPGPDRHRAVRLRMTLGQDLAPDNLVAYERNGAALPREHGYPARLIAPGWHGVVNVMWLTRIELSARRCAGRDYVTIRMQVRGVKAVWTFTTVGKDRLTSAAARVTRPGGRYTITGAVWGAPVSRVEVSIDGGPCRPARPQRQLSRVTEPARPAATAGASGPTTGALRPPASTRCAVGRTTPQAASSRRRTIRSRAACARTGRPTVRSPAGCGSAEGRGFGGGGRRRGSALRDPAASRPAPRSHVEAEVHAMAVPNNV